VLILHELGVVPREHRRAAFRWRLGDLRTERRDSHVRDEAHRLGRGLEGARIDIARVQIGLLVVDGARARDVG